MTPRRSLGCSSRDVPEQTGSFSFGNSTGGRRTQVAPRCGFEPAVACLALVLLAPICLAQEDKKAAPAVVSEVRDTAAMFDDAVVRKAKTSLLQLEAASNVPTFIETVRNTGGGPLHEVVTRNAAKWGKDGVYILIDRDERRDRRDRDGEG